MVTHKHYDVGLCAHSKSHQLYTHQARAHSTYYGNETLGRFTYWYLSLLPVLRQHFCTADTIY